MSDFEKQLQKLSEVASRKKAYAIASQRLELSGEPQALLVVRGKWSTMEWSKCRIMKSDGLVSVMHRSQKWHA